MEMTIFPGAFSASTNLLNLPEFAMVKEELAHARNEPHLPEWPLIKDALDKYPLQAIFIERELDLKSMMRAFNHKINRELLQVQPLPPGETPAQEPENPPAAVPVTVTGQTSAGTAP